MLKELQVSGPQVDLELSTVLAKKMMSSQKINGLVVQGLNETQNIPLPRTYTRDFIPAQREHIPIPETARQWLHLESITCHTAPLQENTKISLLIGNNCTRAIKPREIIPDNEDDPYRTKTALGWSVDKQRGIRR